MKKCILIMLMILLMVSCSNNEKDNRIVRENTNQDITMIRNEATINQSLANKIKQDVSKREAVVGIRGINTESALLLAIKVKQLKQFVEQDIEKEIKKSLEKDYPNKSIDVSSDQKIFLELDQLEQAIQNNQLNKADLNKKYEEIKTLLNEKT